MARRPDKPVRSAGFFWQGVLILLPVVVLVAVGFVSIHQDKAVAQREALDHAQTIADEIADATWNALVENAALTNETRIEMDWTGRLRSPPPAAPLPEPQPLRETDLASEQLRLWNAAQCDIGGSNAATNCMAVWREFIATKPAPRFLATAQFRLALLLAQLGDSTSARDVFGAIARDFPEATSEAGLPLAPLAMLKSIELMPRPIPRGNELGVLCERITTHPGPMTPLLLDRAVELDSGSSGTGRTESWRQMWQHQEYARRLYTAAWPAVTNRSQATNSPVFPRLFWFETGHLELPSGASLDDCHWLAVRMKTNSAGAEYVFRPALDQHAAFLLDANGPSVDLVHPTGSRFRNSTSNFLNGRLDSFHPSWTDTFLATLAREQKRLPPYFGLSLSVAHRTLFGTYELDALKNVRNLQQGTPMPLLASARKVEEGTEFLHVGIHLVAPELLYERQQARSLRFGLLIVVSALAAFIGFLAARRAFLRTQQLSEMKSNFVSSVSHELRAPIASVRLMAENLERGKVTDAAKQHDYFRFIVQECRRLSSLIENVLDFARIEQRRKQYEFEPTDVEALVQQTVKLMEPAAAEKNVTLQIAVIPRSAESLLGTSHGDGTAPRAEQGRGAPLLDAPAIQQALVNLLDNAVKHSRTGGKVIVEVSTKGQPPFLRLSVIDDGPGIPESEHEKIFQRFYRRGSEMRRETPGVGIGLSIVKHIVEAHGGQVVVDSAPGKGSRFTMELPFEKASRSRNPTG